MFCEKFRERAIFVPALPRNRERIPPVPVAPERKVFCKRGVVIRANLCEKGVEPCKLLFHKRFGGIGEQGIRLGQPGKRDRGADQRDFPRVPDREARTVFYP